jgi:hypothetical protein
MLSWMIQSNPITGRGIDTFNTRIFAPITALACIGQIIKLVGSAAYQWRDMLHRKRIGREAFLRATILTASLRSLDREGTLLGRQSRFRHG